MFVGQFGTCFRRLEGQGCFSDFKFLGWFKRVNFLLEFEVIDSL